MRWRLRPSDFDYEIVHRPSLVRIELDSFSELLYGLDTCICRLVDYKIPTIECCPAALGQRMEKKKESGTFFSDNFFTGALMFWHKFVLHGVPLLRTPWTILWMKMIANLKLTSPKCLMIWQFCYLRRNYRKSRVMMTSVSWSRPLKPAVLN